MHIIFEGIDNVGKTTQIQKIQKYLYDKPIHKLHYSNFKDLNKNILDYSKQVYNQMVDLLNNDKYNLILDRAHLGEYVYGKKYRNYTDEECEYVFELEKKIKCDVRLIVLIDSSNGSLLRDDGLSLSIKKIDRLEEIERFKIAFKKSNIKNKILIDIKNKSINDVYNIIINFLFIDKRK